MNKVTIPTILAMTILVAGLFALMPIDQAATVHTTITADTQTNADDQERALAVVISAGAGAVLEEAPVLISFDGSALVGVMAAKLLDSDGGGAVDIECFNLAANIAGVTDIVDDNNIDDVATAALGATLAAQGDDTAAALPGNCEAITVDITAGEEVLITIAIDVWPEI